MINNVGECTPRARPLLGPPSLAKPGVLSVFF